MVPTSWQDEALARDGVSREIPCSALKGETVPYSLPVTPKSSPTRRVPSRGTPRVPAPLHLSPFSPPDRDRRVDSPAWSGGVPGLPGAPEDEAGLTRKFETSHVGGATCRTPPIPRSALNKNTMPGHLFESKPVDECTTRRGTDIPMHSMEKHADSKHRSTSVLSSLEELERHAEFRSSTQEKA